MLLKQEPTFFVFMVVTQEPTIRKCKLLLMFFTYPGKIHHVKPKFKMPNVLKEIHAWLHEILIKCTTFPCTS